MRVFSTNIAKSANERSGDASQSKSYLIYVFFTFPLFGGMASIVMSVIMVMVGIPTNSWPGVQGKIIKNEVVEHRWSSGTDYHVRLDYEYVVSGKKYQGHRREIIDSYYGNKKRAEAAREPYSVDSSVTVYYYPKNPEKSILKRGIPTGTGQIFIAGIVLSIVGIGGMYLTKVLRKRKVNAPPKRDWSPQISKDDATSLAGKSCKEVEMTPPRSISPCARLKMLCFANVNACVAAVFVLTGLGMLNMTGGPSAADMFGNWEHSGEAVIRAVEKTNGESNGNSIYAYHFSSKSAEGTEITGVTHQYAKKYEVGQTVPLLKCRFFGDKWKLEGTAFSTFGMDRFFMWVFIVFSLLFIIGAFALWFFGSFLLGWKRLRLMANGEFAEAVFLESRNTNVMVNMKTLIKMVFRFRADDRQIYEAVVYTTCPGKVLPEMSEKLAVFYDSDDPEKNYIPRAIPGLNADVAGNTFTYSFLRLLPDLLIAALLTGINGFVFYLLMGAVQNGKVFGVL